MLNKTFTYLLFFTCFGLISVIGFGQDANYFHSFVTRSTGSGHTYHDTGIATGNADFISDDLGTFPYNETLILGAKNTDIRKYSRYDLTGSELAYQVLSQDFGVSSPINITTDLVTPAAFCSGSNVNLNAAATGADTYYWQEEMAGSWINISGANGSMNIAGETVSLTLTSLTTTKRIRCLFTNSGGVNSLITTAVMVTPQQPNITVQPVSQTDCESNVVDFTVNTINNANFQWQRKRLIDASFTNISGATSTGVSVSTLSITTSGTSTAAHPHLTEYRCVITDANTCTITSDIAKLSVNTTTKILDKEVCQGQSISFTAPTVGTINTIKWQKRNSGSTTWNDISGANTTTLALSNIPISDNGSAYRVVIVFDITVPNNNGIATCQETSSTTEIGLLTVKPLPTAPTADNISWCGEGIVILSATSPLLANESFRWYETNVSTTVLGTSASYSTTPLGIGTYTYYLSVYNSSTTCESTRTPVTVTVNALPTISLGNVADICNSATSFSLPFSSITNSPNQYSISAGSPALDGFSAISNATLGSSPIDVAIPANAAPNIYQFIISVKNSSTNCVSPDQTFTVKVNDTPVAPIVTSLINYCQNAPTNTLSATANGTNTLLWYGTNNTGGTSSLTPPTPSSGTIGTVSYYVSQKNNDNCESSRASISVVIHEIPVAPTTSPINYCQNASSVALTAANSGSNSLLWYGTSSTGSISSNVAPIPNTGSTGIFTYYVSQISPANCESLRAAILVTINDLPIRPIITSPIGYCQNTTATALSATATGSNTLLWYGKSAIGGTSSGTAPIPATNVAVPTSYYVSQKDANNCESLRAKIDVEITPTLTGEVKGANAFCISGALNNSTTLTAAATGGNGTYSYQWQNLAGNIPLATNQTFEVNSLIQTANSDTYKVTISSGYCTATANLTVTKQGWTNPPSVSVTPSGDICGSGIKTLAIVGQSGTFRWFTDATTLAQINTGPSFTTPNITSTITYYTAREQQITASLTCQTNRTPTIINVSPVPSKPIISSSETDNVVCAGTNIVLTANGCTGTIVWSNGVSTNAITVSSSGTYTATCTVNGCVSPVSDLQTVVVNAIPIFTVQPTNQINCRSANQSFTGTVNIPASLQWEYRQTSTGVFANVGTPTTGTTLAFSATNIGSATYPHGSGFRLKATSNGCVAYSNIATLSVNSITGDIPDQNKCNGEGTTFNLNDLVIIGTISSYQWEVSTSASTGFTNILGSQFSGVNTNSLVINPVSASEGAKYYRCRIVFTNTVSGSCTISTLSGKLNVAVITPPIISGVNTICLGSSTTLTANGCSGAVMWNTGASGSTLNVSSIGTYSATCTQTNCTSVASNGYMVSVNSIPTAPTITSNDVDNIICEGNTITLTANACAGTVIWSNNASTNAITVSSSGTYTATCTVNGCVSPVSSIQTIIVNSTPNTPTISGSTSICAGSSTSLTANGCSGVITWNTGATGSTLTVSSAGTYNAICTVGNCVSLVSSTHILLANLTPTSPTIIGSTSICAGTNTILTANGCSGIITWNTGVTGSTITVASAGTFNATCTENSCISSASLLHRIIENQNPNITLGAVNSLCNNVITFDLAYTATANNPDKYSLTSTMPNFMSVAETNIPISPISIAIPSGKIGTHNFTLNIKNSTTSCVNSQTFSITILPALAGGSIEVSAGTINCVGYNAGVISSVSLATGGKMPYVYQWQNSTDGVNFTDISGENLTTYDPPVLQQTTYFRRKLTDACGNVVFSSNVHQIQIVPDPLITITDASERVICSGESINLAATVIGGSGTCTAAWQSSNTQSGTYVNEQVGGLSFNPTLTNSTATAVIKYYRAVYSCSGTGSGSCNQGISTSVKVTVNPVPSVPTIIGNNNICAGTNTTLTASGCNGTILWSSGSSGTSVSVLSAGIYRAFCVNSCGTSAVSNEIVVIVNTVNAPVLSGATSICGGQTAILTATGCAGTVVWSNASSGTSITVSPSTTTTYTATCKVGVCTSLNSESVAITVVPSISFTVGNIADLCNTVTSFTLPYTLTIGSPDRYSLASTMPGFSNITDGNLGTLPILVSIPSGQIGTFIFTLTLRINSTGCNKSETFSITILPALAGGSIEVSAGTINCAGYNAGVISSVSLATGGKTPYVYQWQNSTDGVNFTDILGENLTTYDPPVLQQTTYFRRKLTDACGNVVFSSNVHQIQIVPDPLITITDVSERVICSGESINLAATVIGGSGTCTAAWQSSNTQSGTYTNEQVGGLSFNPTLTNSTATAVIKYYRAVYSCNGTGSGNCNQGISTSVKVTVNPVPSVPTISPASIIICSTQSTTLTANGCIGNITWNNGQTGNILSVSVAGSYTAICSSNNCNSAISSPAVVSVASGGTPVSPPAVSGSVTICNGQSANLTATGCAGLVTWSNGNTGTLISVSPSILSNYTATCFDGTCISNTSNQITITVNNYPTITTQPKNESDCDGNSVTFSVSASSVTSYQWQRKIPNGTFTDIANGISNSLTISNVGSTSDPNQTEYRVVLSNGNCALTSIVALLTVNSVVGSLADQTICDGANTSFNLSNVVVTGNIQSYQWQRRVGTSGTWNDIIGATATTFSINAATNADEQYYRCKVTFTAGSSTCARYTTEDDTNGAKLSVLMASTPTITGTNAICLGKNTTLKANDCDGVIIWSSGQSSATITVSPITNTSYTVSCISSQCGFNVSSVPYLVTVNATPQPEIITYDVITPATLTFAARISVPNATLMWYNRASGGTGSTTAPSFSAVGTYSYWVTQTDPITGCESARLPIIAKVLDYFRITQQPINQIDCRGNSVFLGVVAVGPNTAFTYQWQRKRPGEPDFVNLVEEGNGIRGWYARTMVVSNVGDGNNPNQTQYRCVVSDNGQSLTSEISTLTVNSINGSLPNLGICFGQTNEFNLNNYFTITGNVLSYQWQTRPGTSGTWTNLNDGNGIAGSITNALKFTNASYEQGVYYRCLVKFNTQGFECTEPTDAARLIVSGFPPAPSVSNVFYCQNSSAVRLKVDSPIQNLVWYSQETGGEGSKTAPTPNTTVAGEFKYYVADRTDEGCEGPRAAINVGIGALPPDPKNTTQNTIDEREILVFSAEGTPSENQVLRWYTSPTTSTFTTTAPVFTTSGTYNRYVAQVSVFGCVGPRTFITATIIPSLKFTRQPISQADCDGNSVTFSVTATAPTIFSYQWQRQKPNETSFTDLENETSNSLRISNVGSVDNPNQTKYRCVIKDDKKTTISEVATLTVNQIIDDLAVMSLCDGKESKLTFNNLTTTGKITKYQWQKRVGNSYIDIPTDVAGVAIINEIATYRGRVFFEVERNTTCNRTTNDLKVESKPTPTAPLVTDQIVCQNVAFDIKKAVSAANSLLWYESVTDSIGNKILPKVDTSKLGKTTYFISQINVFGCESERKSFNVEVAAIPEKPVTSDLTYCRNAPSLALVATTLPQNQVVWYALLTTKDAFSKIPIPNTKTDGEIIYFAASKNAAGCESERVPLKILIAPCIATFENNFNNCLEVSADSIKGNQWFDLHDKAGKLYASVNPNGIDLGKVSISISHYGRGSAAIPSTKNDTKLMARYIDFQSSILNKFPSSVSLRIFYQNDELEDYKTATNLPNLTINDFNIVHYDGIREDCGFENNDNFLEGESHVIYKNVLGNRITKEFFYLQFDVNDFSENGATANDFTEITFSGQETEQQTVQLNWQSKFEVKAEKYILERSEDCKNFVRIGEIKANGTSSIYENTDFQPLTGKNCYRLVYIDKDGTKKYLEAIEVNFTDTSPICSVFPNPWIKGDEISLYLRNIKEKEIKLYDMLGHSLSYNLNKNDNQIIKIRPDVYLSKGVHFVVIIGEDGKKCVQKIVINP